MLKFGRFCIAYKKTDIFRSRYDVDIVEDTENVRANTTSSCRYEVSTVYRRIFLMDPRGVERIHYDSKRTPIWLSKNLSIILNHPQCHLSGDELYRRR